MDGAMDEVVADACEMMLRDSEAVQQLAKENRSLAEKIRDWISDNTRTERDILADAMDGDANTVREMEMLREYKEKLGRYTVLTKRLEQQRELAQTAESKDERLRAKNRADNLGSLRRLDSCRALTYAPPLLDHGGQPLYPTTQKVPGAERRGLPGDATSNGWYVRRCYTS